MTDLPSFKTMVSIMSSLAPKDIVRSDLQLFKRYITAFGKDENKYKFVMPIIDGKKIGKNLIIFLTDKTNNHNDFKVDSYKIE